MGEGYKKNFFGKEDVQSKDMAFLLLGLERYLYK